MVFADVEVAAEHHWAARSAQALDYRLALFRILLAGRIQHKKREQVRIENAQRTPVQGSRRADQQAVGGSGILATELELYRRRRQNALHRIDQRRLRKYGQPDTERQLARIRFGVCEKTLVLRKRAAQ